LHGSVWLVPGQVCQPDVAGYPVDERSWRLMLPEFPPSGLGIGRCAPKLPWRSVTAEGNLMLVGAEGTNFRYKPSIPNRHLYRVAISPERQNSHVCLTGVWVAVLCPLNSFHLVAVLCPLRRLSNVASFQTNSCIYV